MLSPVSIVASLSTPTTAAHHHRALHHPITCLCSPIRRCFSSYALTFPYLLFTILPCRFSCFNFHFFFFPSPLSHSLALNPILLNFYLLYNFIFHFLPLSSLTRPISTHGCSHLPPSSILPLSLSLISPPPSSACQASILSLDHLPLSPPPLPYPSPLLSLSSWQSSLGSIQLFCFLIKLL